MIAGTADGTVTARQVARRRAPNGLSGFPVHRGHFPIAAPRVPQVQHRCAAATLVMVSTSTATMTVSDANDLGEQ